VFPLDHFQGDAEVVEDGHGSRVSVLSSQFSVVSGQWSERKDLAGVVVNVLTLHCYCGDLGLQRAGRVLLRIDN
jgi:hypothetical protein